MRFVFWKRGQKPFTMIGREILSEEEGVPFFRNRLVQLMFVVSLFAIVAGAGILGYAVGSTDTLVIIHYNVHFGVDIFGSWWQIYALSAISLALLVGNTFLAKSFYDRKERMAGYILLFAALFTSIAGALASGAIAIVNV